MSESGNDMQIEFWQGDVGRRWADNHARTDSVLREIGEKLLGFAGVQGGERVLDLGCGAGATTLACADLVAPGGSVVGLDVSEPLLDVARRRVAEAGVANVELVLADAAAHAFAPVAFDRVISRLGVMFFADPPAAFANIRRGMRPGARLAFVCFRTLAECPWFALPWGAAKAHLPDLPTPDSDAPGPFAFGRPERVRGILDAAGFGDVTIEPADPMMHGGDLEKTVEFLVHFGPLGRAVAEASEDRRRAAGDAARAALVPHVGADGIHLPAGVWLVGARA
ncbi:MAG TPA: methyltransferase domain-containing protein [Acidisphaera sp.]|nr:methyltransferase domain-containing protein [Acidisphaera sp.]